jgi:Mg2+/citrate symporter
MTLVIAVAIINAHEDLLNSNIAWVLIGILPVLDKGKGNYGKNKGEMATTRYALPYNVFICVNNML